MQFFASPDPGLFPAASINPGLHTALGGAVVDPTRFDPTRLDSISFARSSDVLARSVYPTSDTYYRQAHPPATDDRELSFKASSTYTIGVIVISALIFVTVISCFDIVRNALYTFYPLPSSTNPVALSKRLLVISILFTLICVVIAVVVTIAILRALKQWSKAA